MSSDTEIALEEAQEWFENEHAIFGGIYVMLLIVMILILIDYAVERTRTRFVQVTAIALVLGSVIGLIIRGLTESNGRLRRVVIFDEDFFFLVLLPPIIFESGLSMKRGNFFRNSGIIALLAWLGTLFSAVVVGAVLYALGKSGAAPAMAFPEAVVFGALISATDPVSVLAVFRRVGVDKDLNAIVFGESALNDAVAIVLVRSLAPFLDEDVSFGVGSVFEVFGRFLLVFSGSVALGACFALASALVFKYARLYEHPLLETSVFILLGYQAYMLAEGIYLSGIVTMLFSSIINAHYTMNNLSRRSQALVRDVFRVLAMLAELFIFAYLGVSLFAIEHKFDGALIAFTLLLILATRGFHVTTICWVVNRFRPPKPASGAGEVSAVPGRGKVTRIPASQQLVLWFAGLRGAIAFALAMSLNTPMSELILSTTLVVVLVTVLVFGNLTEPLLYILKIESGPEPSVSMSDVGDSSASRTSLSTSHRSFGGLDKRYLIPFFTRGYGIKAAPNAQHGGHGQDETRSDARDDGEQARRRREGEGTDPLVTEMTVIATSSGSSTTPLTGRGTADSVSPAEVGVDLGDPSTPLASGGIAGTPSAIVGDDEGTAPPVPPPED